MSLHPEWYDVLERIESESSPGKFHEIRTSKRDHKTYCTCRGWYLTLKFGKKDGICKHIASYMARGFSVTVYKLEEFLAVRRAKPILGADNLDKKLHVRRPGC